MSVSIFNFLLDHIWSLVETNYKIRGNWVNQAAATIYEYVEQAMTLLTAARLSQTTVSSLRQTVRGLQVFLVGT